MDQEGRYHMPVDPSLAACDRALFFARPTGVPIWLSPDIVLTGPISGLDQADEGEENPIRVTVHRNPDAQLPDESLVFVDVYVGNPGLAMSPVVGTTKLTNAASRPDLTLFAKDIRPGVGAEAQFAWIPPSGLPPGDPEAPGHRCLIARCYPDICTPSPSSFFFPDEPHVAQHNIAVVAAREGDPSPFPLVTVNPHEEERELVTVRAEWDRQLTEPLLTLLQPRFEPLGFKQIARRPPRRVRLEFEDLKPVEEYAFCDPYQQSHQDEEFGYEAKVFPSPLEPFRVIIRTDVSSADSGDAHVFHVTQFGPYGELQGGFTFATVVV
jgi:hypothetical protein